MQVALNSDGKRCYADKSDKGIEYKCPICGSDVILRKGDINVHHFAHKAKECSDSWHYDMSEWHYRMQSMFPEEQREVVVKANGVVHRADVLHGNKVIEFQHSPISGEEILERNRFYRRNGYWVAWVFDLSVVSDRLYFNDGDDLNIHAIWKQPYKFLSIFKNSSCVKLWFYVEDCGTAYMARVPKLDDYRTFSFEPYLLQERTNIDIEDFFIDRDGAIRKHLSRLGKKFETKYMYAKGYKKYQYDCPKTWDWCSHAFCGCCKSCGGIADFYDNDKERITHEIYCCYPDNVTKDEDYIPRHFDHGRYYYMKGL